MQHAGRRSSALRKAPKEAKTEISGDPLKDTEVILTVVSFERFNNSLDIGWCNGKPLVNVIV